MGVKIHKIRGKWYLVVDYRGRGKKKAISISKAVAEDVKRKVEARLALGDMGIFKEFDGDRRKFSKYAEKWLREHGQNVKASTIRSYEQLLRVHLTPRFGEQSLNEITRNQVKDFLAGLSENPDLSRNTVRSILTILRTVLNAAVEDGLIESNPAARAGKFNPKAKGDATAQAMTRGEAEQFLQAVREVCPEHYALFFCALRSGLRRGELCALQWGDIQFGESDADRNRFILVQRNYYLGKFTSPKGNRTRRVDMTRHLRAVLLAHRQQAFLRAFQQDRPSIANDLVFPSEAGTALCPDNIGPRWMQPALEAARLRKFRFHDLRHTFGALLIQAGISPAYVQLQMGHASIQITVDTYGHLIPGENLHWIDTLDASTAETSQATSAHQEHTLESEKSEMAVTLTKDWLPSGDSGLDMLTC